MTLIEAVSAIREGSVTAAALADAGLARVDATEAMIGAWVALDPARVRAVAATCDANVANGALRGIGIGVKDIIDTAGLPTQMGTPLHAGRTSARDAKCIARLKSAGGYVFGKTVTTELAFMHPASTRNPWNCSHTPGGSSSGSAAAVAAGHVTAALGTQTNGSVIRPAAYCGVVGFKPTLGAIDTSGVNVFSETLDTLGTFTRCVGDAALLAGSLAGGAGIASHGVPSNRSPRLARLDTYPWTRIGSSATDALDRAVTRLRDGGAVVQPVTIDGQWRDAPRIMRTIMLHEAARNLGALQRIGRDRMSQALNAALDEGAAIGGDEYRTALEARGRAITHFRNWLAPFDAVLSPPAPGAAPAGLETTGDPSCCTLWSLLGFPALALPIDVDAAQMPLGMQLVSPDGTDDRLLAVGAWCESRLGFSDLLSRDNRDAPAAIG